FNEKVIGNIFIKISFYKLRRVVQIVTIVLLIEAFILLLGQVAVNVAFLLTAITNGGFLIRLCCIGRFPFFKSSLNYQIYIISLSFRTTMKEQKYSEVKVAQNGFATENCTPTGGFHIIHKRDAT
ncbi:hypothetical protein ACJX0J_028042, partial [Zea mays]